MFAVAFEFLQSIAGRNSEIADLIGAVEEEQLALDITGARWGLHGAEAILQLRAIHTNGGLDTYWQFHLTRERQRVHQRRYLNGTIPQAA